MNGVTTQFVYDGMNPVQEFNGTGTPTANLMTGLGIDEYFLRTDATGARSFLTDALGSSIALTDSAGIVQTRYTYEPYGETTFALQANSNSFEYTGRESDGAGLYYYRARYYDPVLKRFISEDPIGLAGGINSYAYVGGNPISRRDPLGLWTVQIGGSASYTFGIFGGVGPTGNFFAGITFDSAGNFGTYYGYGYGVGVGAGASAGVSFQGSNAKTICDLRDDFTNIGIGGGWGPSATGDGFVGNSPNGRVVGGGVTIGPGLGASGSATTTNTTVNVYGAAR